MSEEVKTNKKGIKKILLFVGIGVAVIGLVIGGIFGYKALFGTKKIDLSNYLIVDIYGYKENGRVNIYIDYDELYEDNMDVFTIDANKTVKTKDAKEQAIINEINLALANQTIEAKDLLYLLNVVESSELFNNTMVNDPIGYIEYVKENKGISLNNCKQGDVINYSFVHDFDVIGKLFDCEFVSKDDLCIIDCLNDIQEVDFIGAIKKPYVKYRGPNTLASARPAVKIDGIGPLYEDQFYTISVSNNDDNCCFTVLHKDLELLNLEYYVEGSDTLSNGDTIYLCLSNLDELKDLGLTPKVGSDRIEITVENLPEPLTSADGITKDLVEKYLLEKIDDEESRYVKNFTVTNFDITSIVFLKMPTILETDEPVFIIADFSYDVEYEDGSVNNYDLMASIYNPSLNDGELGASRYSHERKVDLYDGVEQEFAQVGVTREVNDFKDFLDCVNSDDMQLLINAGYEDGDYIRGLRICFINEDTTYIY